MNSMSLKGALRYDIKATLRGLSIFLGVIVLVWLLNYMLAAAFGGNGAYSSGSELALPIYVFVAGIISVREDLRLFLQNGRGRKTVFVAQVVVAFFACIATAVAMGLLLMLFYFITRLLTPQLTFASQLGLFGLQGMEGWAALPKIMAFLFLASLPSFFFGMLISLIYYRLSKLGKVVFSVVTPGVLFIGLPVLVLRNAALLQAVMDIGRFLSNAFPTPLAFLTVFSLVFSCIFVLGSWLLLRRAEVK